MATSNMGVMSSLFGPALTQGQYRDNYLKDSMITPREMMGRTLDDKIFAIGSNAGGMLGYGVGKLLGGQTPEETQNEQMRGMLGGVNMNDPEALFAAAQNIQGMNPAAAQALVAQATDLQTKQVAQQKSMMDTRQKEYEMEQEQVAYQNRFRALKAKFPEISDEEAQGIAGARESFDKVIATPKTDTQVVETAAGQVLINKQTGETIANLGQAPDRRSITNVNVSGTAENEYAKKVGAETATQDVTLINSVKNAPQSIKKLEETLDLIDKGQLNTGIASGLQDTIARARSKFLADKAAKVNVADSQYLDSLLGSDVFAQIQALGIGARGLDTPAEREFLLSVVTGTRALDKETLRRMTQFRLDAIRSSAEAYNDRIKNGELEQYQRITGRQLKPVELSSAKGGQQLFPNAPPVGTVKNGFRYNGGDPAQPTSWSKK
jgi:hypothetical protein